MNTKLNNVFAAVLAAGIVAGLAGFIAEELYEPEMPEKPGFELAGGGDAAEGAAGATAAPAVAEPINDLLATADVAAGEKTSKICAACHSFEKGGPNKVGPDLFGVIGRARASHEGFAYSDAMKAKGGSWTVDELNEFLWNPKKFVPGTKMSFAGLKKPEDRAALIKWLETQK